MPQKLYRFLFSAPGSGQVKITQGEYKSIIRCATGSRLQPLRPHMGHGNNLHSTVQCLQAARTMHVARYVRQVMGTACIAHCTRQLTRTVRVIA